MPRPAQHNLYYRTFSRWVIALMGGCQAHHIPLTPAPTRAYYPTPYTHITSATHLTYPCATIEVYALCIPLGQPMVRCYDSVEQSAT